MMKHPKIDCSAGCQLCDYDKNHWIDSKMVNLLSVNTLNNPFFFLFFNLIIWFSGHILYWNSKIKTQLGFCPLFHFSWKLPTCVLAKPPSPLKTSLGQGILGKKALKTGQFILRALSMGNTQEAPHTHWTGIPIYKDNMHKFHDLNI